MGCRGWRRRISERPVDECIGNSNAILPSYAISQRIRKRVEEIFGWTKTIGGGRKLRYIGLERNQFWAELIAATYNLVRMAKLEVIPRSRTAKLAA